MRTTTTVLNSLLTAVAGMCMLAPTRNLWAQDTTGRLQGEVFSMGPGGQKYVIPGAKVTLMPEERGKPPLVAVTDQGGEYVLEPVPAGRYRLTAASAGLSSEEREVVVTAGQTIRMDIELKPEVLKQEIKVAAEAGTIDTTETSSTGVVRSTTLINAPSASERFESLLPLLPGVIRGPDGLLNPKGARSTQAGLLVNSTNVTDPYTGGSGINLPIDVVSKVEVRSNPYDAAYGKFAGAVTTVDTRPSNFDKFHVTLQNFFPRLRRRNGTIMGLESVSPRLTATGPLWKERVAITQSLEYRFVRTRIPSLPDLQNDTAVESFDSFTQADIRLSERQTAFASVSFFPQKLINLGLNTFTPQEATPDLRQRGYLVAFQHKYASASGGLMESAIAWKVLDANLRPHSDQPFRLAVETTQGGFFSRQNRDTDRLEWQETYHFAPLRARGQHLPKIGMVFARNSYHGWQRFAPVEVLRASGQVAERSTFGPDTFASVQQNELSGFVQDRWNVWSRLTVDAGVRFDRDSVVRESNLAPRLGMAWLLTADGRTVLRAGVGSFYDRVNLNSASFLQFPERTVTRFSPSGTDVESRFYRQRLAGGLHNPLSIAWSAQLDRQVVRNLYLRVGYQQRNTTGDFVVQPLHTWQDDFLVLDNSGRNSYREFELTTRYRWGESSQLTASYVRSATFGDLNDVNQFYGNVPGALIRPNERSLLPFDAPNRFLFWGEFRLPFKLDFSPVLDIHTGFPYSIVDEERNFVGVRNRAGRFPRFASLDVQLTRQFHIPFFGKKYKVRAGIKVFNLLNSFNPRDLQNNLVSPRFGEFFNSVERTFRGKFIVEY